MRLLGKIYNRIGLFLGFDLFDANLRLAQNIAGLSARIGFTGHANRCFWGVKTGKIWIFLSSKICESNLLDLGAPSNAESKVLSIILACFITLLFCELNLLACDIVQMPVKPISKRCSRLFAVLAREVPYAHNAA